MKYVEYKIYVEGICGQEILDNDLGQCLTGFSISETRNLWEKEYNRGITLTYVGKEEDRLPVFNLARRLVVHAGEKTALVTMLPIEAKAVHADGKVNSAF